MKSTGPKTLKGKANSRWNALKHGLFIRQLEKFEPYSEDMQELCHFHARLRGELQPVGVLEEMEVERITVCWWRLARVWRYENAEIWRGKHGIRNRLANEVLGPSTSLSETHKASIRLLVSMKEEIERNGEISKESREKLFAENLILEFGWSLFQEEAEKKERRQRNATARTLAKQRGLTLQAAKTFLENDPSAQRERARHVALETTQRAIRCILEPYERMFPFVRRAHFERQAIPDGDALDEVLRAGSAYERDLSRALDRLERLQRRRNGEVVPPPVTLQLNR